MKSHYSIPPYLGLNQISKTKDNYIIELGYSKRLKKKLFVDKDGMQRLTEKSQLNQDIQSELVNENILKSDFRSNTPDNLKRYDRHMLFFQSYNIDPLQAQQILSKKTVALIGMGGIGNWVSLNLIGSGFKELRLIDFDTVELSNLTRQVLFDETAIGMSKVKAAKKVLSNKNSQTKIVAFDQKVQGVSSLKKYLKKVDFIIISADRPAQIHDWVNTVAVKMNIPYLNIGYRDTEGVVGPLTVPGKTSCYQCFKEHKPHKKDKELTRIQNKWDLCYQAPSFGPLNAIISSLGAIEVIKYFTKFSECESLDTELCFDPATFKLKKTSYQIDENCRECCK